MNQEIVFATCDRQWPRTFRQLCHCQSLTSTQPPLCFFFHPISFGILLTLSYTAELMNDCIRTKAKTNVSPVDMLSQQNFFSTLLSVTRSLSPNSTSIVFNNDDKDFFGCEWLKTIQWVRVLLNEVVAKLFRFFFFPLLLVYFILSCSLLMEGEKKPLTPFYFICFPSFNTFDITQFKLTLFTNCVLFIVEFHVKWGQIRRFVTISIVHNPDDLVFEVNSEWTTENKAGTMRDWKDEMHTPDLYFSLTQGILLWAHHYVPIHLNIVWNNARHFILTPCCFLVVILLKPS